MNTNTNTNICTSTNDLNDLTIIGITGRKRSGKDTVGEYLVKNHGFIRVAFADALKEACKIIFGLSDEQVYGDQLKEVIDEYWQHSPREILQKVGSELFRDELPFVCQHIDNDIWIRSVERQIENLQKLGHRRFVVTDVRFDNELDFIKIKGGKIWKVTRDLNHTNPNPCTYIKIDDKEKEKEKKNEKKKKNEKMIEFSDNLIMIEYRGKKIKLQVDITDNKIHSVYESVIAEDQGNTIHQSEAMIDHFPSDVLIENVYSKEKLFQMVEELMSK
jgi:hypothetical protein